MKMTWRSLVYSLLFLLALAATVSAQFNWCPTCFMVSYVDIPGAGQMPVVSRSGFTIAGWGFVCEGGAPADRVDLWYQRDDGWYEPLPQPGDGPSAALVWGLARPDIPVVYEPYCPGVSGETGWHLWVTNSPPPGVRRLVINVWRGPFFEGHSRQVVIE